MDGGCNGGWDEGGNQGGLLPFLPSHQKTSLRGSHPSVCMLASGVVVVVVVGRSREREYHRLPMGVRVCVLVETMEGIR